MIPSQPIRKVQIPASLKFADLKMTREGASGMVSWAWAPLIEIFRPILACSDDVRSEGNRGSVLQLILRWYMAAQQMGEPKDSVMEQLLAEMAYEKAYGLAVVAAGSSTRQ